MSGQATIPKMRWVETPGGVGAALNRYDRLYNGKQHIRGEWIEQKPGARNCGQIAISVLTGIPLRDVNVWLGWRGTTTIQLHHTLARFGVESPMRLRSYRTPPDLAIAKVRRTRGHRYYGWHWVVWDDGLIYDGIGGAPDGTVDWPEGTRITSYLPVTLPA